MSDSTVLAKPPPRYVLMAQRLVDEIVRGKHPVGSLLPTEAVLCAQYDVSRHTVREALREVQALGLVARYQGIGTRVISATPSRGYTHTLSSIDDLLQFATGTRLVDVTWQEVVADEALAEAGHFLPGQRLVRFEAIRVPTEDPSLPPLSWSELYIIDAYAGIRDEVGLREGAVGALIEQRYGARIMEIQQEINAMVVDEDMGLKLDVAPGTPALHIERWYCGDDGKVFEYAISINPKGRYSHSMRLSRDLAK
jgi:DNA-binding GntR family transcriptional regulator